VCINAPAMTTTNRVTNTIQLDVGKFADYRAFLLSHVQDQKRNNPDWTYGMWVKKLGLKDTSSITKIIQGRREPGTEITDKLVHYFAFKPKDAQYFRDLVRLHKIKNDSRLAVLLLEKMGKDHPDRAFRLIDDKTFTLISNWYCIAIREMVRLDEFFEDPNWISKRMNFKVTPTEVSKAIDMLLQAGLLRRDKNNNLKIAEGRFHTKNDFASEAIKRYHEASLDNARLAIRNLPVEQREITASVLTMSCENIPKAKELIREFKDRFCRLLEEDKGSGTFQIQIQFFPLTKIQKQQKLAKEEIKSKKETSNESI